jgi:hypothetical protein
MNEGGSDQLWNSDAAKVIATWTFIGDKAA